MSNTLQIGSTPVVQIFKDDGTINSGGRILAYDAGSTSPAALYLDYAGLVSATTITLDASGRAAFFWGSQVYKIDIQTSEGVSLSGYPRDNVVGSIVTGAFSGQSTLNPGINANGYANQETATINKAGSGTHAVFAGFAFNAPTIGAGSATLTEADTVYIVAAPTGGSSNNALHVASGTSLFGGPVLSNAPTGGGIGYATGAGSTVTQATNRTTGVTINTLSGAITTSSASLAAEAAAVFVVTNSTVAIGDVPIIAQRSGANGGNTDVYVSAVAAGSFSITVANNNASGGTAETGAIVVNYAIVKAVSA